MTVDRVKLLSGSISSCGGSLGSLWRPLSETNQGVPGRSPAATPGDHFSGYHGGQDNTKGPFRRSRDPAAPDKPLVDKPGLYGIGDIPTSTLRSVDTTSWESMGITPCCVRASQGTSFARGPVRALLADQTIFWPSANDPCIRWGRNGRGHSRRQAPTICARRGLPDSPAEPQRHVHNRAARHPQSGASSPGRWIGRPPQSRFDLSVDYLTRSPRLSSPIVEQIRSPPMLRLRSSG